MGGLGPGFRVPVSRRSEALLIHGELTGSGWIQEQPAPVLHFLLRWEASDSLPLSQQKKLSKSC